MANIVKADMRQRRTGAVLGKPGGVPFAVEHGAVGPGEHELVTVLAPPVGLVGPPSGLDHRAVFGLGFAADAQGLHGGRVERHHAVTGGGLRPRFHVGLLSTTTSVQLMRTVPASRSKSCQPSPATSPRGIPEVAANSSQAA